MARLSSNQSRDRSTDGVANMHRSRDRHAGNGERSTDGVASMQRSRDRHAGNGERSTDGLASMQRSRDRHAGPQGSRQMSMGTGNSAGGGGGEFLSMSR